MKKDKLKNKIQMLEDVEYLLIEENNNLRLLVEILKNIKVDVTEKRFRTIQRTVSRLQEEIREKNICIKKQKKTIRELELLEEVKDTTCENCKYVNITLGGKEALYTCGHSGNYQPSFNEAISYQCMSTTKDFSCNRGKGLK